MPCFDMVMIVNKLAKQNWNIKIKCFQKWNACSYYGHLVFWNASPFAKEQCSSE